MRTASALVREAAALHAAGDTEKASVLLDGLLELRPYDLGARSLSALVALARQQRAAAAALARDLLRDDPLDPATYDVLAAATDDVAERERALYEAYTLDPSVEHERRLKQAHGISTPPALTSGALGRLYRRAGLHEMALGRFQEEGPRAALEEAIARTQCNDLDGAYGLLVQADTAATVIARAIEAAVRLASSDERGAAETLADLTARDHDLEHVRRLLPQAVVAPLAERVTIETFAVHHDGGAVRVERWDAGAGASAPAAKDTRGPAVPPVMEEPVGPEVPPAVTVVSHGTPTPSSIPERLAGRMILVQGVMRALVIDRNGRVLADMDSEGRPGTDPLEAKVISATAASVWNLERFVPMLGGRVDSVRVMAGDQRVYAWYGLRQKDPPEVLVLVCKGKPDEAAFERAWNEGLAS